jgi:acylphosphatase
VQGVGFRLFVLRAAQRLNLKGYVRNMPDGTLQVVASGPRASLQQLLAEIERGPVGAHVSSVDTTWQEGEAAEQKAERRKQKAEDGPLPAADRLLPTELGSAFEVRE